MRKIDEDEVWNWLEDHSVQIFWTGCALAGALYVYGIYKTGFDRGVLKGQELLTKEIAKAHPEEFMKMLNDETTKVVGEYIKTLR